MSVWKWDTVQVLGRILLFGVEFAFSFLQYYTVKLLDN